MVVYAHIHEIILRSYLGILQSMVAFLPTRELVSFPQDPTWSIALPLITQGPLVPQSPHFNLRDILKLR